MSKGPKPGTLEAKIQMAVIAFVAFILFAQWWFALAAAVAAFVLASLLTESVPS